METMTVAPATTTPDEASLFLLPIDPGRGARRIISDVEHFAMLDPKIRKAREQLSRRIEEALPSEQGRLAFGALSWIWVRSLLIHPCLGHLPGFPIMPTAVANPSDIFYRIRLGLIHSDAVQHAVEEALATTLSVDQLRKIVRETEDWAERDQANVGQLQKAQDELLSILAPSQDVAPAAVVAIGVGAFLLGAAAAEAISEYYHHHHQ